MSRAQPLLRHVECVKRFDVTVDGETILSMGYGPGTRLSVEDARSRASTFTRGVRKGLAIARGR